MAELHILYKVAKDSPVLGVARDAMSFRSSPRRIAAILPIAISPRLDAGAFLSGAQFSDAYTLRVDERLSAREAAERMVSRSPWWATKLLAARDRIVAPFGIKTSRQAAAAVRTIGFFPVLGESDDRVIVGLNDRHLDFRLIIDVTPDGAGCRVTATTIVLTHGLPGRVYLAAVLPFHRRIVRNMLAQVAG